MRRKEKGRLPCWRRRGGQIKHRDKERYATCVYPPPLAMKQSLVASCPGGDSLADTLCLAIYSDSL